LICRDCDKNRFKTYEDPNTILNFENLHNNIKNQILKEMALKTHLAHIYSKAKSLKLREIVFNDKINTIHTLGLRTAFEIDIDEHFQYIKTLSKTQKTTSFTFDVLYNNLLDYEVGIATQTIIAYQYDLLGNQLFNPKDFSSTNFVKYFYLMILPYEGKTRIMFYIERKHKILCQSIINQFNDLSPEEKLHFLFISLIIHDEQFYINPTLQEQIRKDKKLVKLYTKTDANFNSNCFNEIKNFRKYTNYLTKSKQPKK
jgi:hypothetical protein